MSRLGKTGSTVMSRVPTASQAAWNESEAAKLERYSTPYGSGAFFEKMHQQSLMRHQENGTSDQDVWFVLLDQQANRIKWHAMGYKDAWKRNENLKGTGFSWARCDKPDRRKSI